MSSEVVDRGTVSSIIEQRKHERPYFNESLMLSPTNEYVCWVDVMGSQSVMLRSLSIASNFLMKLHVSALRASRQFSVYLYPVIDGIYVCSQTKVPLLNFVNRVYSALAQDFIHQKDPLHRFVIRSGLAFGPVARGTGALQCSYDLSYNRNYAKQILFGPPLTQAYQVEKQSAPFGVALHESTRSFAPNGEVLSGTYWKWWKLYNQNGDDLIASLLFKSLKAHYDWCLKHTVALSYEKADIERHRALAEEYFSD
jgi:hypothetical protein